MQNAILVSKVCLELYTTKKVRIYPINLHSICYVLAGKKYPHLVNKPPLFHPIISDYNETNNYTIAILEISSIDEQYTALLINNAMNQKVVELGYGENLTLNIRKIWLDKHEILVTSPEFINKTLPDEFEIHFVTPTVFQTNSKVFYALPSLMKLMMSVSRNIYLTFGTKITRETIQKIDNNIGITAANVESNLVLTGIQNEREIPSFVGMIKVDISQLNENEKRILTFILKWAEWMGVGKHRGYGMGAIKIKNVNDTQKSTSKTEKFLQKPF